MVTWHHKGYSNARLALARLAATVRSPANLVVSGSSAGGYGATINYSQIRGAYPNAKSYLIDDSAPIFVGDSLSGFLKTGWSPSWNLDATVFKICPDCKDGDWSLAYSTLVKSFPNDRMALLSTEQDATIGGYLLTQPTDFKKYVYDLVTLRFDPTANFRYFIQTGKTHTMLFDEDKHTTGGVNVATWVNQMVTNDAAWKAVKP